jgi:hypothetical protein
VVKKSTSKVNKQVMYATTCKPVIYMMAQSSTTGNKPPRTERIDICVLCVGICDRKHRSVNFVTRCPAYRALQQQILEITRRTRSPELSSSSGDSATQPDMADKHLAASVTDESRGGTALRRWANVIRTSCPITACGSLTGRCPQPPTQSTPGVRARSRSRPGHRQTVCI